VKPPGDPYAIEKLSPDGLAALDAAPLAAGLAAAEPLAAAGFEKAGAIEAGGDDEAGTGAEGALLCAAWPPPQAASSPAIPTALLWRNCLRE